MPATLSRTELFNKLCEMATEHTDVEVAEMKPESRFTEDLGFDSLDITEYVMQIEDEFGINVPDEAAEKVATIGDATDMVLAQLG